jgi:hypothetical protein
MQDVGITRPVTFKSTLAAWAIKGVEATAKQVAKSRFFIFTYLQKRKGYSHAMASGKENQPPPANACVSLLIR